MSTDRTAGFLWSATALGGILAAGSYVAAGPPRFWANWLVWFLFLFTLALGALFLVALEHLAGARWSVPLRRIPERLSLLLVPLTAVGLVALGALPVLYPGARPGAGADPVLAGKAFWLGLPFFSARVAVCLALGLLAVAVLVRGSLKQDRDRDPRFTIRARRFAPVVMAIFALLVSQAAFDWIAGLEPKWYSDVIGVYLFAGAFLAGLAARRPWRSVTCRAAAPASRSASTIIYSLGGMAVRLHRVLGLHRLRPVPAHVVREPARGGLVVPGPQRGPGPGGGCAWCWPAAFLHALLRPGALGRQGGPQAPALGGAGGAGRALASTSTGWSSRSWARTPLFSWPELGFALFFIGGTLLWMRRRHGAGRGHAGGRSLPQGRAGVPAYELDDYVSPAELKRLVSALLVVAVFIGLAGFVRLPRGARACATPTARRPGAEIRLRGRTGWLDPTDYPAGTGRICPPSTRPRS